MHTKRAIVVLFLTAFAFAVHAQKSPLTGTWVATVTPPVEAEVPPFQLIMTFGADGTLLTTGTGGEFPALGNPCQGGWSADSGPRFTLTYLCLDFNSGFQPTGMDKIRGSITVDEAKGDFRGRLDLTNFDLLGTEVFTACCATVSATRLPVERLPDSSQEDREGGRPPRTPK